MRDRQKRRSIPAYRGNNVAGIKTHPRRYKVRGTGERVAEDGKTKNFEAQMLPHLNAAWNLARWLTRSDHDAHDVVQEAFLRAYRFYEGFRGVQSRSWLLAIVRNTAYSWMEANRGAVPLDENGAHDPVEPDNPESLAVRGDERRRVNAALARLPAEYREVLVLREMEEMSYREIALVAAIPIGTVMSRLARGRKLLSGYLAGSEKEKMK
jgi:RNA polymerase sigma factor (sigma-70 family)